MGRSPFHTLSQPYLYRRVLETHGPSHAGGLSGAHTSRCYFQILLPFRSRRFYPGPGVTSSLPRTAACLPSASLSFGLLSHVWLMCE